MIALLSGGVDSVSQENFRKRQRARRKQEADALARIKKIARDEEDARLQAERDAEIARKEALDEARREKGRELDRLENLKRVYASLTLDRDPRPIKWNMTFKREDEVSRIRKKIAKRLWVEELGRSVVHVGTIQRMLKLTLVHGLDELHPVEIEDAGTLGKYVDKIPKDTQIFDITVELKSPAGEPDSLQFAKECAVQMELYYDLEPDVCGGDFKPFQYQLFAKYVAKLMRRGLESPDVAYRDRSIIRRMGAYLRTGAGKTVIILSILDTFDDSDIPKFLLVPTDDLKKNIVKELLDKPNKISERMFSPTEGHVLRDAHGLREGETVIVASSRRNKMGGKLNVGPWKADVWQFSAKDAKAGRFTRPVRLCRDVNCSNRKPNTADDVQMVGSLWRLKATVWWVEGVRRALRKCSPSVWTEARNGTLEAEKTKRCAWLHEALKWLNDKVPEGVIVPSGNRLEMVYRGILEWTLKGNRTEVTPDDLQLSFSKLEKWSSDRSSKYEKTKDVDGKIQTLAQKYLGRHSEISKSGDGYNPSVLRIYTLLEAAADGKFIGKVGRVQEDNGTAYDLLRPRPADDKDKKAALFIIDEAHKLNRTKLPEFPESERGKIVKLTRALTLSPEARVVLLTATPVCAVVNPRDTRDLEDQMNLAHLRSVKGMIPPKPVKGATPESGPLTGGEVVVAEPLVVIKAAKDMKEITKEEAKEFEDKIKELTWRDIKYLNASTRGSYRIKTTQPTFEARVGLFGSGLKTLPKDGVCICYGRDQSPEELFLKPNGSKEGGGITKVHRVPMAGCGVVKAHKSDRSTKKAEIDGNLRAYLKSHAALVGEKSKKYIGDDTGDLPCASEAASELNALTKKFFGGPLTIGDYARANVLQLSGLVGSDYLSKDIKTVEDVKMTRPMRARFQTIDGGVTTASRLCTTLDYMALSVLCHTVKDPSARILVLVPHPLAGLFALLMSMYFGTPAFISKPQPLKYELIKGGNIGFDREKHIDASGVADDVKRKAKLGEITGWFAIDKDMYAKIKPKDTRDQHESELQTMLAFFNRKRKAFREPMGGAGGVEGGGWFGTWKTDEAESKPSHSQNRETDETDVRVVVGTTKNHSTGVDFRGITDVYTVPCGIGTVGDLIQLVGRGGRLCDMVNPKGKYTVHVFLTVHGKPPDKPPDGVSSCAAHEATKSPVQGGARKKRAAKKKKSKKTKPKKPRKPKKPKTPSGDTDEPDTGDKAAEEDEVPVTTVDEHMWASILEQYSAFEMHMMKLTSIAASRRFLCKPGGDCEMKNMKTRSYDDYSTYSNLRNAANLAPTALAVVGNILGWGVTAAFEWTTKFVAMPMNWSGSFWDYLGESLEYWADGLKRRRLSFSRSWEDAQDRHTERRYAGL